MADVAPTNKPDALAAFDDHAVAIARRQYFQEGDGDLLGMFRRVAEWVARPEPAEQRAEQAERFYRLMASKRFCPGGRVLAGAATAHGNVLNCFVQDGQPEAEGTDAWVLRLATKLAVVTKVGGGNGLNLDPLPPKRAYGGPIGALYLTISPNHADYEKVRDGTFMDLVHGSYTTRGYHTARYVEYHEAPVHIAVKQVGDSVESIWDHAAEVVATLLRGDDLLLDLSGLRAEGTPVNGSGGTSSGPSSFAVEVFDNFARWAGLGGAAHAGPVATLRYVFAPTLRVIRQGGCLVPETLVHTSRGTLRLEEIVDPYQGGWQDHHLKVATDDGWKDSTKGFNAGNAPTKVARLANGQIVQGTPDHRLKVARPDGRRDWVRLEDLRPGDHVIQVLDQHTGAPVSLRRVEPPHQDAVEIRMPEVLGDRVGLFLGLLWGGGFVGADRVGIAVAHGSPLEQLVPALAEELFGVRLGREQEPDDAGSVFVAEAGQLIAWLRANGLAKPSSGQLEFPRALRTAPRSVVAAFLRGLFETDGALSHGYPELSTASERFARDVAVMLAGLGVPASVRHVARRADRDSRRGVHRVRVQSRLGLTRFVERVGFVAGSRLEAAASHVPASDRSRPLAHGVEPARVALRALPASAEGRPAPHAVERRAPLRHGGAERSLKRYAAMALAADPQSAGHPAPTNETERFVRVTGVEDGPRTLTLDLSVAENETYLANGVVGHNTRRGAGMATISITHPDVHDFITSKDLEREQAEGDISTFNISVLVTDGFMRQAQADGPQGVLWEIAQHAWQTGEPGLIYVDRINEYNPMRASLGEIKSTNPCFTADTRIATHRGLITLGELYETREALIVATDRRAHLGEPGVMPRAAVPVFRTRDAAEVYRLQTTHGYEVRATADHRFLTPAGWVELQDLAPGDTLMIQSGEGCWSDAYAFPEAVRTAQAHLVATAGSNDRGGPASRNGRRDVRERFEGLPTGWSREFGAFLGFLSGDGFLGGAKGGISFARTDLDDLQPWLDTFRGWFGGTVQAYEGSVQWRFGRVSLEFLAALGFEAAKATEKRVPEAVFTAPREAVVGYLQGLFTADGTVNLSAVKRSCSVRLASSSPDLLRDVQRLLSNFGIVGRLRHRRPGGAKAMPDGRGGAREYAYADQYELLIDKANRDLFARTIGFLTSAKQARLEGFIAGKARRSNREDHLTQVERIEFDGVEPVYDTTEPVTHSIIANGLVAHQCGEIPLFPGEPCDLGAINLAAYVRQQGVGMRGFDQDAFREDVGITIRFLDNVLEVNKFALEDNREMSHYLRRLGLGIMGLADALIRMGYRYDSDEGRAAVGEMITALREAATTASWRLAEERGEFPAFASSSLGRPRRNIALLTVAPTGTTSMLMGVSSGVEPIFAPFVYRKIGAGYAALVAPLFRELMERHEPHEDYAKDGQWDWEKVVQAVQENHGSVQGLGFVPDDVRAVLVCAHDIAPADHVKMQGVVQTAFDAGGEMVANSISKTINLPNEATVDDVYEAYSLAFATGCKGITVYRDGSRQFQVLSTKAEKKVQKRDDMSDSDDGQRPERLTPASGTAARLAHPAAFERLPGEPLFDRPARLAGFTDAVKLTLPTGEKRGFYVTVNMQDGLPVEVFITSGKAGDEANADSEALGRVVSIALQYGVPAEALVKTLRGINGGMYGSYEGRLVASRADLIAVALETAGAENPLERGQGCPDCGAPLRFEEGCRKCEACGYSKCG